REALHTRLLSRYARQTRGGAACRTVAALSRRTHERLERSRLRPPLAAAGQLHDRRPRPAGRGWLEGEKAGLDARASRRDRDTAAGARLTPRRRPPALLFMIPSGNSNGDADGPRTDGAQASCSAGARGVRADRGGGGAAD